MVVSSGSEGGPRSCGFVFGMHSVHDGCAWFDCRTCLFSCAGESLWAYLAWYSRPS